ncbi:DUF6350 family protein [Streptomyces sp. LHD-70]|uniref:cell division protein PerM n=1 Tax=Streptomyces sp. LHD-70 TaxID=3072140 RepID=UPI00280F1EDF|nr:DUF6350 family protein [Streptomyces sp. LHD-70]MDQ8704270.1 DUF6350 family protein [Streptomyces sp. LHD-70]
MTHTTDRSSSPRPPAGSQASAAPPSSVLGGLARSGRRRRSSALLGAVVGGGVAAGVGLGGFAVLVIAGWVSSPYPDSGADGALHVAAGLWLLAHGADLVRTDGLSGDPAPLGVTPLLLAVVPALLLHRAGRDAADSADGPRIALGGVVAGYLAVGALATLFATDGPLRADPLSAGLHLVALAVLGTAAGVWNAYGRPHGPLPARLSRLVDPDPHREGRPRPRTGPALRAAAAGVVVLVGGGALLVAVSLVVHAQAAQTTYLQLSDLWAGRVAVLLLAIALVPNAAVWGASYGLGPGFTLGASGAAWPAGAPADPQLPPFPLLAAIPDSATGTPLTWAACAVGGVCGLTVGWFTARAAAPKGAEDEKGAKGAEARAWSRGETALTAGLAALLCGLALALLAALAGGPLGDGALADFGPVWWQTGGAALLWSGLLGTPVALGLRAWRVRTWRARDLWARAAGVRVPVPRLPRWARVPRVRLPRWDWLPRVRLPRVRLWRRRAKQERTRPVAAGRRHWWAPWRAKSGTQEASSALGFEPYDFSVRPEPEPEPEPEPKPRPNRGPDPKPNRGPDPEPDSR